MEIAYPGSAHAKRRFDVRLVELADKTTTQVEGLTVILVTHDPEVARNAKRNIVLRDGHVIADTSDFSQAMQSLQSYTTTEAES